MMVVQFDFLKNTEEGPKREEGKLRKSEILPIVKSVLNHKVPNHEQSISFRLMFDLNLRLIRSLCRRAS